MTYKRIAYTVLFALLFATLSGCRQKTEQAGEANSQPDSFLKELEAAQRRNDSLEQLLTLGITKEKPMYFGKAFDTIENPEEFIITALRQKKEKIPIDAVLGGNMEFRQIEVLTEDWILAVYDDGHIQGKSIFRFELQPNGEVKFSEIVSKLPNGN